MLRLAIASLRGRLAASLATFSAVTLGCAILVGCGGIFETAIRLQAVPERLAGAPIIVTGPESYHSGDSGEAIVYSEKTRLSAPMEQTLQAVPGVKQVVLDTTFSVRLTEEVQGRIAHGWRAAALTPYALTSGAEPQPGQVVIDQKVAETLDRHIGDRLPVIIAGNERTFVVAGLASSARDVREPAIFLNDQEAQQLPGTSTFVDAYGIFPEPAVTQKALADDVRRAAGSTISVLTGDDRAKAEFLRLAASKLPLILLAAIFGGMAVVVMILVVSATIGLSVRQRQRELALLRVSGATPRQVRRMVVIEIMLIAFLALAGGVLLGVIGGQWFFSFITEPMGLVFKQGAVPLIGGAIVVLGATWATAQIAARSAAKTKPIQALVEASLPPVHVSAVRMWLARIFMIMTVLLAVATLFMDAELAAAIGGPAVLTGAIAVGLMGPNIVCALVAYGTGVARKLGGEAGNLAVRNVRAQAVQFSAILTALTLAVAITLGNVYSQTTQNAAVLENNAGRFDIAATIWSSTGIGSEVEHAVQEAVGTSAVSRLVMSTGWIEQLAPDSAPHTSGPWQLTGVDIPKPGHGQSVFTTPVRTGSIGDLQDDTVALPAWLAERLRLAVGDTVTMRFGDGQSVAVRIVALLDMSRNDATVVLPASLLVQHTTQLTSSFLLVRGSSDTSPIPALTKKLAAYTDVQVGDAGLLTDRFTTSLNAQAWISYILAVLAIVYAAIATVNAVAVVMLARRREFALLRLLGATRTLVVRMAVIESALIAAMATVLGSIIALFTIVPMAVATRTIVPQGPLWVWLGTILATFLITVPAAYWASRKATKNRAIDTVDPAE